MRRTFRPVQKATSESALVSPAGVAIWAAGLELYSAFRAEALPPITAFFHCCSGGKAGSDFPAGVYVCPKQQENSVANTSKIQVRSAIRDNDLMYSPTGLIASIAEPCDSNVRHDRDGPSGW